MNVITISVAFLSHYDLGSIFLPPAVWLPALASFWKTMLSHRRHDLMQAYSGYTVVILAKVCLAPPAWQVFL